MDRICRVLWPYLWCGGLLCVLSALSNCDAQAATRKYVNMPSSQSVLNNPSGPATRNGNNIYVPGQPLEGEYIPGIGPGKTPVRGILPGVEVYPGRTYNYIKNGLRSGGAIGIGVGIGLQYLLDQVDAIIEDGIAKVPSIQEIDPGTGDYWWRNPFTLNDPVRYSSPVKACNHMDGQQWSTPGSRYEYVQVTKLSTVQYRCVYNTYNPDGSKALSNWSPGTIDRFGTGCPSGSTYDTNRAACVMPNGYEPLPDSGYDTMFDIANQQNAEWLKDLIKDTCNGSLNPAGCFEEMKDFSALSGPAEVNGPSTTKTTTSTNSSGVTTQTVVTTNTKYNITYGDTYYDYRKTTTTKTATDGVPESETTEEESAEVEEEQQEDQQEEPALCAGEGCDGPAYVDQYEPTDVTKEDAIDSYLERVSSIPIIAAVSGIFSVSVDGACPVWEVHTTLAILAAVMPINLRFDYLCLSWVIALKPWIQAVMFAVCAMLAVRIALL